MTLFNIIRDFFVMYVFGGITSDGQHGFGAVFGDLLCDYQDGTLGTNQGYTTDTYVKIDFLYWDTEYACPTYIAFGDWLSTTATIITLVVLFVGISLLTIKLFKIVSNIIALR